MIYKANKDAWNGIFRRGPKRMDREEATAIANEAYGMFSRRKTDSDAERHGPTQTTATR